MFLRLSGMIVVIGVGLSLAGCGGTDRDDTGKIDREGDLSVFELRVNDCLTNLPKGEGEQKSVKAAPCTEPHEGEVFTVIDLGEGDWPGDTFVNGKAERGCPARLKRAKPPVKVELFYFTPTEESWDSKDDHSITCIAVYPKSVTGLLEDQSQT